MAAVTTPPHVFTSGCRMLLKMGTLLTWHCRGEGHGYAGEMTSSPAPFPERGNLGDKDHGDKGRVLGVPTPSFLPGYPIPPVMWAPSRDGGPQGPCDRHLKSKADGGHGVEHGHPGSRPVDEHKNLLPVNPTQPPTTHHSPLDALTLPSANHGLLQGAFYTLYPFHRSAN